MRLPASAQVLCILSNVPGHVNESLSSPERDMDITEGGRLAPLLTNLRLFSYSVVRLSTT
jgi:hypothetical protein